MKLSRKKCLGTHPIFAAGFVAASLFLASPAPGADSDDDKKKAEKQLKKAEEEQGKKKDEEKEAPPALDGEENPLPKIVDLMKKVEERLAGTDTGTYTQEEQKKIVEALNLGDKAKSALDDLIKKIEEMQQQMQGQGGEDQQKKQQQQQNQPKNETPEQRAEREKQEREKQEREKREEERRKSQNPQQKPKQEPKDSQKTKNDKKEKERRPPEENANLDPRARQQGRWGDLPAKLHGDAEKARQEKVPERFRDEIEKYRQATSD
jgi:hypothetical protein